MGRGHCWRWSRREAPCGSRDPRKRLCFPSVKHLQPSVPSPPRIHSPSATRTDYPSHHLITARLSLTRMVPGAARGSAGGNLVCLVSRKAQVNTSEESSAFCLLETEGAEALQMLRRSQRGEMALVISQSPGRVKVLSLHFSRDLRGLTGPIIRGKVAQTDRQRWHLPAWSGPSTGPSVGIRSSGLGASQGQSRSCCRRMQLTYW